MITKRIIASNKQQVMIGREAFNRPWFLRHADARLFGTRDPGLSRREIVETYLEQVSSPPNRLLWLPGPVFACPGDFFLSWYSVRSGHTNSPKEF